MTKIFCAIEFTGKKSADFGMLRLFAVCGMLAEKCGTSVVISVSGDEESKDIIEREFAWLNPDIPVEVELLSEEGHQSKVEGVFELKIGDGKSIELDCSGDEGPVYLFSMQMLMHLGYSPMVLKEMVLPADVRSMEEAEVEKILDLYKQKKINLNLMELPILHAKGLLNISEDEYLDEAALFFGREGNLPVQTDSEVFRKVVLLHRPEMQVFSDFLTCSDYLYSPHVIHEKASVDKGLRVEGTKDALCALIEDYSEIEFWEASELKQEAELLCERIDFKAEDMVNALCTVLTGKESTSDVYTSAELLGQDRVMERLKAVTENFEKLLAGCDCCNK